MKARPASTTEKTLFAATLYVLLVLGCALTNQLVLTRDLRTRIYTQLIETETERARSIRAVLDNQTDLLKTAVKAFSVLDDDVATVKPYLRMLVSETNYATVAVVSQNGHAIFDTGFTINLLAHPSVQAALNGESSMSYSADTRFTGKRGFLLAVPIWRDGAVSGALLGVIDDDVFCAFLLSMRFSGEESAALCGSSGVVLVAPPNGAIQPREDIFFRLQEARFQDGVTVDALRQALERGESPLFEYALNGVSYYGTFSTLGLNNWYIFTVLPKEAVLAVYAFVRRDTAWLLAAILLLTVGIIVFLVQSERVNRRRILRDTELVRRSEEKYRLLAELTGSVVFEADASLSTIVFGASFERVYGVPLRTVPYDDFVDPMRRLVVQEDVCRLRALRQSLREGHDATAEFRLMTQNGPVWVRAVCMLQRDGEGCPYEVLGKLTNIDDQVMELNRLKDLAALDPLTGVLNRSAATESIEQFLSGRGYAGRHALLVLDVDDFKRINDVYGHQQGDYVLSVFASTLRTCLRDDDIVGRLGGDEFFALLKNFGGTDGLVLRLRKLIDQIEHNLGATPQCVRVTCSIGVACYPDDGHDLNGLYEKADAALYRAKLAGKNGFGLAEEESNDPNDAD